MRSNWCHLTEVTDPVCVCVCNLALPWTECMELAAAFCIRVAWPFCTCSFPQSLPVLDQCWTTNLDTAFTTQSYNVIYTVSQKNQDTKLMPVTSPNNNNSWFSKFFRWQTPNSYLTIPPHLKYVTTLPCNLGNMTHGVVGCSWIILALPLVCADLAHYIMYRSRPRGQVYLSYNLAPCWMLNDDGYVDSWRACGWSGGGVDIRGIDDGLGPPRHSSSATAASWQFCAPTAL